MANLAKIFLAIGFGLFFLIIPVINIVYSQEPEKIEKVIATGVGIDFEKAKQNAIRNAIEQVVGTYVTSDTMVKTAYL